MLQKSVYDFATNTTKIVNYERACLIFEPTGLCTNIIDIDEGTTYTPPTEYYYVIDYSAQIGWTWDGGSWSKPTDILIDAYLEGNPTTETPELDNESLRVPNTFWVAQKINDYINNVWLPTATIDGGSFSDAAIAATYNAGDLDGNNTNLSGDLTSPDFSNSGGNLSGDINGGTF